MTLGPLGRLGRWTATHFRAVALAASQQNVSKHLGVLLGAGIVTRSRDGNFVRYAIADNSVFDLCETVCGGVRRRLDDLNAVLEGVEVR